MRIDPWRHLAALRLQRLTNAPLSQLSLVSQGPHMAVHLGSEAVEAFEERAAIMEYEGGLSRAEAEARALATLLARHSRQNP